MKLVITTACSLLISSAQADRAVEGSHPGVPSWWTHKGTPAPERSVRVIVAVKQNKAGAARLERELLKRSDPYNRAWYGKWLKKSEVDSLVKPSETAIGEVTRWLKEAGAEDVLRNDAGDFISGTVTVQQAEAMLGSHYQLYAGANGGSIMRLNGTYTLPAGVATHVDFVGPGYHFPLEHRHHVLEASPSSGYVTPTFLRKLYNVSDAKGSAGTKNIMATASFDDQYYSSYDLSNFFAEYASSATITTPTVIGLINEFEPATEASLDIQYGMGVGRDIPTQFWSTAGKQPDNPDYEPWLKWLEDVSQVGDDKLPLSFSGSYGEHESSAGGGDVGGNPAYGIRVNTEFQKLGARGCTVLLSSGDGGAYMGSGQFPASSPWTLSIGATRSSNPETTAYFSGGGFSRFWSRPSFQDAAVNAYIKKAGIENSTSFNNVTNGAAGPDVSAQGVNFAVIVEGVTRPVSGTSASCPTFNGIIALLNEARLAAGKSSLGYIVPFIYKMAGPQGAFNDITTGTNGLPALAGWDAATGWGTPKFEKLKELVLALP